MKFKQLSLVFVASMILVGCNHKIKNNEKNINEVLQFNQTYHYDLDQDGKKDTITIKHDDNKTILSINGKNAKYLYPYKDVEARLIGLGSGTKMIALTLKEGTYLFIENIDEILSGGQSDVSIGVLENFDIGAEGSAQTEAAATLEKLTGDSIRPHIATTIHATLDQLTHEERDILQSGCLINFNRHKS